MGVLIVCWWCYGEVCYVIRLVLTWCRVCYVLGSTCGCCLIMVRVCCVRVFCINYLLLLLLLSILLILLLLPFFHIHPHHFLKGPYHHINHPTTALLLKPFILYLLLPLFSLLLTNHLIWTWQVTISLLILMLVIFPLWYVFLYLHYLLLTGGASFCLLIGIKMMTFGTESALV